MTTNTKPTLTARDLEIQIYQHEAVSVQIKPEQPGGLYEEYRKTWPLPLADGQPLKALMVRITAIANPTDRIGINPEYSIRAETRGEEPMTFFTPLREYRHNKLPAEVLQASIERDRTPKKAHKK